MVSIVYHGFIVVDGGVIVKPLGGSSTPIETMTSSFSVGALPPAQIVMDLANPWVASPPLSPLLGALKPAPTESPLLIAKLPSIDSAMVNAVARTFVAIARTAAATTRNDAKGLGRSMSEFISFAVT